MLFDNETKLELNNRKSIKQASNMLLNNPQVKGEIKQNLKVFQNEENGNMKNNCCGGAKAVL